LFNLSIKAWDNHHKEFVYWKKFRTTNSSLFTFSNEAGTNRVGWVRVVEHPKRYVMCISFGQHDKNGVELYSSDIVKRSDGSSGVIMWSTNHARFVVKYKGKSELVETAKIEKVGDIFHASKSVKSKNGVLSNLTKAL
jgi:hypothetical protein